MIIDFERAMWSVLRQLLPDVRIKGCVFHWTQALWRKLGRKSSLGVAEIIFRNKRSFIDMLMKSLTFFGIGR